jgi:hypothetical protein
MANDESELPPPSEEPTFDFHGATFDLEAPRDREILRFVLSQALYGEATGVYCGKSLYTARSLEAAHFYVRQAKQELGHLKLFADILRALDLEPTDGHWALKLLSAHNNYYPLKVLMEHAIGEGMVLDVFRDLLLQTLPDTDPRVPPIKRKLQVICREEEEHVAWGEKETLYLLGQKPYLKPAFYGLVEAQLSVMPLLAKQFSRGYEDHPVMRRLPEFIEHVRARVYAQGRRLGYVPEEPPTGLKKAAVIGYGLALYARSQLARSKSKLPDNYLSELGFERS